MWQFVVPETTRNAETYCEGMFFKPNGQDKTDKDGNQVFVFPVSLDWLFSLKVHHVVNALETVVYIPLVLGSLISETFWDRIMHRREAPRLKII